MYPFLCMTGLIHILYYLKRNVWTNVYLICWKHVKLKTQKKKEEQTKEELASFGWFHNQAGSRIDLSSTVEETLNDGVKFESSTQHNKSYLTLKLAVESVLSFSFQLLLPL